MKKNQFPKEPPISYDPSPDEGLREEEVAARRAAGLTNYIKRSTAKPTWRIFFDNICTFFNLIWAILIGTLILLNEFDELMFIAVILANTGIAILMELRAKHTLEKLSLMTAPQVTCVRAGVAQRIPADDLVLSDVIRLEAGDQIPADATVLRGICEVNESMLTGETDAIRKGAGDTLFAGSYLISGACCARVTHVGQDNYIQTIAARVKTFKAPQSYLFRDITRMIRWIGIGILPFAGIMYLNNYYSNGGNIHDALVGTAGSVEGMIPAGMFLLITVAFSLGVLKLARRHTQVRDTYSIEMLSRTDTLCLDKTGTITDGTMRVVAEEAWDAFPGVENRDLIAGILAAQSDRNFTSTALAQHYTVQKALPVSYNIPFSSQRKYTATAFDGLGTFAIGAPEFLSVGILPDALREKIQAYAAAGRRVLMLAGSPCPTQEDALPRDMRPLALVVLEDHIRPEAPDTIAWFRENGVTVKIISGDDPVTVSAIARRVGVAGAERAISLEGMSDEAVAAAAEDYTVFGRVTPEQKLILVRRLRAAGHVVSMTGDGINDTMALKEADCSIAMADGSEVARSLSNIVLQDNNFASLPAVVCEGRQVVNNVQRSSTLFLMKTFFAITFSLLCVFCSVHYPLSPRSLLLFELFVTGFPAVILALEPNSTRIEGRFISSVLKKCIPDGLLILLTVSFTLFCAGPLFGLGEAEASTLLHLVLNATGFLNLVFLCLPLTRVRVGSLLLALVGLVACTACGGSLFAMEALTPAVLLYGALIFLVSIPLHILLSRAFQHLFCHRTGKKQ